MGSFGGEGSDEYEILCAELLQWNYANARMENAFATRSKKATDVLVALWDANREQVCAYVCVCVCVCIACRWCACVCVCIACTWCACMCVFIHS